MLGEFVVGYIFDGHEVRKTYRCTCIRRAIELAVDNLYFRLCETGYSDDDANVLINSMDWSIYSLDGFHHGDFVKG